MIKEKFDLTGKVAIVTGSSKGIGEAMARGMAEFGATVVVSSRKQEAVDKVATQFQSEGLAAMGIECHVANAEHRQALVEKVMATYGRIDILINNAGVIRDKSFMKMTEDQWNLVINVNINSLFVTTKAVLPHMIAANYGRIIGASSINAMAGAYGQTNYSASKAAIQGFTRSLCREVGKHGITVNCVAPGFIKTAMTDSIPKEIIAGAIKQIPVRRIGLPEDMAYSYLFLASKEAGFVSGITLHANGGSYPI